VKVGEVAVNRTASVLVPAEGGRGAEGAPHGQAAPEAHEERERF
jgi:hypothetical protein